MRHLFLCLWLILVSTAARCQKDSILKPIARTNLHFQTTYIYQYSARFKTPYSGTNSLSGDEEKQNSMTMTLFAGLRLWKGAEFYLNPELAGGSGLSGALGMGGSSNGETFRVGNPSPTLYLGRAFLVQTFALGPDGEQTEDAANALNTFMPEHHIRLLIGKYSLGDLFDINLVSNSPRTSFINWSLMNTGAWDYAANVRGYTLAAGAELSLNKYAVKLAAASLPTIANGDQLSTDYKNNLALNLEFDHSYKWKGKEGNVRLLLFSNHTHMGNYAIALENQSGMNPPDVVSTRAEGRRKSGIALNADQEITPEFSLFTRIGWNDGKNETWCFTEIDRTIALGANLKGKHWNRADDELGIACVSNGLSDEHRNYLANGGLGFILGDGKLNYGHEIIGEMYYSCKVLKAGLWLTADYQFCGNPGYNRDRGPANIASIRLHVEL